MSLVPGAVAWIRWTQEQGRLDPGLDPELYLLATIALNMFPNAFPQITRSVTGAGPGDPAFVERWQTFLLDFGGRMRPPTSSARRRSTAVDR